VKHDKRILKILATLAVGLIGLWTFGLIRISPFPTLLCKGKMVSLPDPDAKPKYDIEKIIQVGLRSITIDNVMIDIEHDNNVKIEFVNSWEDKTTNMWFVHMGWLDRTNGNAQIIFKYGKMDNRDKWIDWYSYDLKCSKAPERIF
jgi:hypothetical protein